MTTPKQTPELDKYIDGGVVIPAGTHEHLWVMAAAWADTTVKELLADTAPVRAAHYEAAVRVEKALDAWDGAQSLVPEAPQAQTNIAKELRVAARWMAEAAAALPPHSSGEAAEWARASAKVYDVCHNISGLRIVKGL